MSYEAPVYYLYWILTTLRDYDHYMDRMMDDGQRADKQDDVPRTDRLNHDLLRYHFAFGTKPFPCLIFSR